MPRCQFSKRAFLSGAIGSLIAIPGVLIFEPAREGAKELMDHWKADKVVVQEVNVPVEVIEERVVFKEVPVEVTKEVEVERVKKVSVEVVREKIVCRDIEADPEAPPPPPLPLSYVPSKQVEVKNLFNKRQIRMDVAVRKGSLPSIERARDESYTKRHHKILSGSFGRI